MTKRITLDPEQLRYYREKMGLSQREVGLRLRQRNPALDQDNQEAAEYVYHRIEKTGSTSRKTAEQLAEILQAPLDYLRGVVPTDSHGPFGPLYARLVKTLGEIYEDPQRLAKLREAEETLPDYWGWIPQKLEEDGVEAAAEEIGCLLEFFSLAREDSERQRIFALFEMPSEALEEYLYVDGLWLVHAPLLKGSRDIASIHHGMLAAISHLTDLIGSKRTPALQAKLTEKDGCHRIEFKHEFSLGDWWVEISRCTPSRNGGIRYEPLPPAEQSFLKTALAGSFTKYAWTLEGFGRHQDPPPEQLAFLVETLPLGVAGGAPTVRVLRGQTDLTTCPEKLFRPRTAGGLGDKRVWHVEINLTAELTSVLSDILSVPGRWQVSGNGGPIVLDHCTRNHAWTQHRIRLVAVDENNELHEVRWPINARRHLERKIEALLPSHNEENKR